MVSKGIISLGFIKELTATWSTYGDVSFIDNQYVVMEDSLKKFADSDNCPVRNVLDRFGDKWSTLVLLVLNESEVMRFNEIHKVIETISQKMLAVTLKSLEADGLITRKQYPEIPPRVEYSLSSRGASLIPHINNLVQWANTNFAAIEASRAAYKR